MSAAKTYPCPICRRPAPWENNPWRPFCSERCKTTDLGNWAQGKYSLPDRPASDEEVELADDEPGEKPQH